MERIMRQNGKAPVFRHMVQAKFVSRSQESEFTSSIDNSPTLLAQRKRLQSLFGDAIQLQCGENKSSQEKFAVRQEKHELGEEEFLPGRFGAVQRVKEVEPLQGKFPAEQIMEDNERLQGNLRPGFTAQHNEEPVSRPNNTGLPNHLKSGIESLSGMSMDKVRVHYNSSQPAQLQAHAFTQGTDIHVAPGQERHLPHEAWHAVQQAQDRVKPTMQMKGGVPVNDNKVLEHEADVMGAKALQMFSVSATPSFDHVAMVQCKTYVVQMATPLANNKLNVVGEEHPETEARLAREKRYSATYAGSEKYWTEAQFRERAYSFSSDWWNDKRAFADPFEIRFNHAQQFLSENGVIIKNDGNTNRIDNGAKDNLESQANFIGNLWIYLTNLNSTFFDEQTDGFEVTAERRLEMLGYRQQVKNIAVTWQAARVALAAARHEANPPVIFDWAVGGVAVTTEANERANFKKSVDDLSALNVVNSTANKLSQDRSVAMHIVANNRSTELGVWKIGEAHRAYIDSIPVIINYNLVSRATFNADYDTWHGV